MLLFKLAERSLGLISTIILARILVPADFGLVAMATAVIALLELLQAFGFDMALIQNQKATRAHYDTVWTFRLSFGLIMGLLMVLLSWPAADFYNEPRLVDVMLLLALGLFVEGFENVGVVAFRKELEFDREFRFLLAKKMASFVVTVTAAVLLRSYWALVIGIVFGRFFGVAASYWLHPYRPRLSLAEWRSLLGFSKWILITNGITFIYQRSADFVIGRMAGAPALGVFNVGSEIANLPTTELIAPINRAIFPGYAKVADNLAMLREGYLRVTSMVALGAVPAAVGISAVAGPMVHTVFGDKWAMAVPVISLIAIAAAVRALQTNTYYVHLTLATVPQFTRVATLNALALVPLLIWFTDQRGVVGAAEAYVLVTLCTWPFYWGAVMRVLDLRLKPILAVIWRPVLSSAVMYGVVSWLVAAAEAADTGQSAAVARLRSGGRAELCPDDSAVVAAERPAGRERKLRPRYGAQIPAARPAGGRSGLNSSLCDGEHGMGAHFP